MAFDVERIERREDFPALRNEWERLLALHPAPNPFLGFDWAQAWLDTIGEDAQLFVLLARREGVVCGLAPLCIQDGTLSFLGYPQSDYSDLIVDPAHPGVEAAFVDAIAARRGSWRRAMLDQMHEENSRWRPFHDAFGATSLPVRLAQGDLCPAMSLADPVAAKKQYYKRNIQNYVNWFSKRGDFRFEEYEDPAEAQRRLEDLFAQHVERWDGTPTPSPFLREEVREFYRRFFAALQPHGQARLFALRLDEDFLAFYLTIHDARTIYLYKTCYWLEHHKHSPGQVILRYLLDFSLEAGVVEMDYARGDEGYKSRFANLERRNRRLEIYGNRLQVVLVEARFRIRYSAPVVKLLANRRVRKLLEKLRGV